MSTLDFDSIKGVTVRDILVGPESASRTDETGPRVLVELTLDQLAYTSITFDRLREREQLYGRHITPLEAPDLVDFWDQAYRDAHRLLDQRIEIATQKGSVKL